MAECAREDLMVRIIDDDGQLWSMLINSRTPTIPCAVLDKSCRGEAVQGGQRQGRQVCAVELGRRFSSWRPYQS